MTLCAVITAGARLDEAFAVRAGTNVKALASPNGTPMVLATIKAARAAGVDHIAVVGGAEVREMCGGMIERFVDEARSGAENQRLALRAWEPENALLYLTCDMPYINAAALRNFLDASPEQTLTIPLTEHDAFIRRFAGAPPFGVTLGGERVVNGGAFLIPAGTAPRVEGLAMQFFNARKSPLRMAALAGVPLLLRFVLRRLRIEHLERRAYELLGVRAQAIRNCAPELAFDVDTLAEYEYAAAHR